MKRNKSMKNLKRCLIMGILLFSVMRTDAQLLLKDYQAHKVIDNKIQIRWEPRSGDEWVLSKSTGFTIEKFKISASGAEQSLGREVIKPASLKKWLEYESSASDFLNEFASGARSFIHPDSDEKKNQFDRIFNLKGDQTRNNKLSLGFLMYSASYDFEIAKLSGLAYEMNAEIGFAYKFVIRTGNSKPIIINVNPETYQKSKVPELTAEWGNKEVELNWDGADSQGDFLGYMISKSEDGVTYFNINEKPRTNNLGLLPDTSALLQMTYVDSLSLNNKMYWYKLEGFDYFGSKSISKNIVSGQGYEAIRISPIIEYANQTDDNHALIKWYMPNEMEKLVDVYRIVRADSDAGPYTTVVDNIAKTIKEYKVPLELTENHFRVEAVPFRGNPVGSISVFIMGQDTIPPAVPEIISAVIDSVGIIELKWEANTETDLWGYRVFKSNFDEQEYSLVSSEVNRDTVFRDTVDINFNTENVFYKIYATDTRDNKSNFTPPVRIEKPDIFPPSTAGLKKLEQKNDSILVYWIPSGSNDVVSHGIFRRAINKENTWTLVAMLDSTMVGQPFVDLQAQDNVSYSYTIIAYDDVGLKSKPFPPRNITKKKKKEKFDPGIVVTHVYDEELNEVTLTWKLNDASRVANVLVYRGSSKNKLGKYKILKGSESMLLDQIKNDEKLYYKIKPNYFEQTHDYYSETVEVIGAKSEK